MVFAGLELARRLEAAEAAIARACAEGQPGSAVLECGGGLAVFQGADSPLTQAIGLGLSGPVRETELDCIEEFFQSRGAPVTIDLCPLAGTTFLELLGRRGYRLTEFNNVVIRPLAALGITVTPRVRRALPDEGDLWSHTVGHGFFEEPELTEEEMNVGRAIFAMPGALCYLASAAGEPVAGGALAVCGGLATLFADSTVPRFRCQGLQRELIAARLHEAAALGCDLAAATTLPGSGSQRNYERMGFSVGYTKATVRK